MNPRIVFAIARKDIIDAVRNLYIFGAIVMPLGFWLLFRVIFPDQSELKIGAIAVYDQGSSLLVERLAADPLVGEVITVRSPEELMEVVRKEAVGGLALPAGFDEAVRAGQTPEATLLFNSRRGGGELAAWRRLVDEQLRELAGLPAVAKLVERDVNGSALGGQPSGPSLQSYTLIMLLLIGLAMIGVFVVPTLLVEEKEKRTLKTILVSPASSADVVAGKAVVGLFYGLLGAVVLLILNDALRGDLALLGLAIVLGGLVMVELGLLLGALFSTTTQVNTWSSVILVLLTLPSWLTGGLAPEPVAAAMRFVPTYYLVQLVEQSRGSAVETAAWVSVAVLGGLAVVLFAGITWTLKRAER